MIQSTRYSAIALISLWVIASTGSTPLGYGQATEVWTSLPGVIKRDLTATSSILLFNGMIRTYIAHFGNDGNYIEYADSHDGRSLSNTTATNVQGTLRQGDSHRTVESPAILQLRDGTFLLVYATSSMKNSQEKHLYARTSNNGRTFGTPRLLPSSSLDTDQFAPGKPVRQGVPDLVQMPNGQVILYYAAGALAIASMRSSDGGQTWTQDTGYRLGTTASSTEAFVDPDAVVNSDGTVSLYFAYSKPNSERQCGGLGCQRIRKAISADGTGFSMIAEDLLTAAPGIEGVIDPDVFSTADGATYMLYGEHLSGPDINLRIAQKEVP